LTGKSVQKLIENEFGLDCKWAIKSTIKCSSSIPGFFADRLRKCFGLSTDEDTLMRVVVSRSEVDLEDIKTEYFQRYGKELNYDVQRNTKGYFRKLIMSIINGNSTLDYIKRL